MKPLAVEDQPTKISFCTGSPQPCRCSACQSSGHLVTVVSTSGLKIVPTQAAYAGSKNAVRTLLERLRQESIDGVLRTTSIFLGYVRTQPIDNAVDDLAVRERAKQNMIELGIDPRRPPGDRSFAIDQPSDVESGDLTIPAHTPGLRVD